MLNGIFCDAFSCSRITIFSCFSDSIGHTNRQFPQLNAFIICQSKGNHLAGIINSDIGCILPFRNCPGPGVRQDLSHFNCEGKGFAFIRRVAFRHFNDLGYFQFTEIPFVINVNDIETGIFIFYCRCGTLCTLHLIGNGETISCSHNCNNYRFGQKDIVIRCCCLNQIIRSGNQVSNFNFTICVGCKCADICSGSIFRRHIIFGSLGIIGCVNLKVGVLQRIIFFIVLLNSDRSNRNRVGNNRSAGAVAFNTVPCCLIITFTFNDNLTNFRLIILG